MILFIIDFPFVFTPSRSRVSVARCSWQTHPYKDANAFKLAFQPPLVIVGAAAWITLCVLSRERGLREFLCFAMAIRRRQNTIVGLPSVRSSATLVASGFHFRGRNGSAAPKMAGWTHQQLDGFMARNNAIPRFDLAATARSRGVRAGSRNPRHLHNWAIYSDRTARLLRTRFLYTKSTVHGRILPAKWRMVTESCECETWRIISADALPARSPVIIIVRSR